MYHVFREEVEGVDVRVFTEYIDEGVSVLIHNDAKTKYTMVTVSWEELYYILSQPESVQRLAEEAHESFKAIC